DARLDELAGGPLSPRVVFTDPQVAAVGHTLESAFAAGIDARAVDFETSGTAGGSLYGRGAPGTSRLVVDEARPVLLRATLPGAAFVGAEGPDSVHAATIAVVGESRSSASGTRRRRSRPAVRLAAAARDIRAVRPSGSGAGGRAR